MDIEKNLLDENFIMKIFQLWA